jgi:hypothetical protein
VSSKPDKRASWDPGLEKSGRDASAACLLDHKQLKHAIMTRTHACQAARPRRGRVHCVQSRSEWQRHKASDPGARAGYCPGRPGLCPFMRGRLQPILQKAPSVAPPQPCVTSCEKGRYCCQAHWGALARAPICRCEPTQCPSMRAPRTNRAAAGTWQGPRRPDGHGSRYRKAASRTGDHVKNITCQVMESMHHVRSTAATAMKAQPI